MTRFSDIADKSFSKFATSC